VKTQLELATLMGIANALAQDWDSFRWKSRCVQDSFGVTDDLNTGPAGTMFGACALARLTGHPRLCEAIAQAAEEQNRYPWPHLPGLVIGEVGQVVARLAAGATLRRPDIVRQALARAVEIVNCTTESPDFFNGIAGRLRAYVCLHQLTARDEFLQCVRHCGQRLLATQTQQQNGGGYWKIPEGLGQLSGKVAPGYAHGAAGNADVLLDWFAIEPRHDTREAIRASILWLAEVARPIDGRSGLVGWPNVVGGETSQPWWCNGAGGIARFLLRAGARGFDVPSSLIEGALGATACATWLSPGYCHGLAGNIEVLLDASSITGSSCWRDAATRLARLLMRFAVKDGDAIRFPTESGELSSDLWTGYAGVAVVLCRLAMEDDADLLSVRKISDLIHCETNDWQEGRDHPAQQNAYSPAARIVAPKNNR
jgi:lantibiotic modifying enzyme